MFSHKNTQPSVNLTGVHPIRWKPEDLLEISPPLPSLWSLLGSHFLVVTSSPSRAARHLAALNSWFLLFNSPLLNVYLSSCGKKKPRGHLQTPAWQFPAADRPVQEAHTMCDLAFCLYIRFSFLQFPVHVPHFLLCPHWRYPQTPHFHSSLFKAI